MGHFGTFVRIIAAALLPVLTGCGLADPTPRPTEGALAAFAFADRIEGPASGDLRERAVAAGLVSSGVCKPTPRGNLYCNALRVLSAGWGSYMVPWADEYFIKVEEIRLCIREGTAFGLRITDESGVIHPDYYREHPDEFRSVLWHWGIDIGGNPAQGNYSEGVVIGGFDPRETVRRLGFSPDGPYFRLFGSNSRFSSFVAFSQRYAPHQTSIDACSEAVRVRVPAGLPRGSRFGLRLFGRAKGIPCRTQCSTF